MRADDRPASSLPQAQSLGRWQFSLGGMFQTMLLLSVVTAIYGGILRSVARKDPFATVIFLGLSLTVPVGLTLAISTWQSAIRWWRDGHRPTAIRAPLANSSAPASPSARRLP